MRCGCPHCEGFMVQSETDRQACVCPHCGYRCTACLGTNSMISRSELEKLKNTDWFNPAFERPLNDEEAEWQSE